jgi:hypothetical protein
MTDLSKVDERAEDLILELIQDGFFSVNSDGEIWREKIKNGRSVKPCIPRRRAEYEATNGYLRMRVSIHGVRIRVSAHRVVYRFFKGVIPEGCIINHKDGKRWNNRPWNLEAITQSQNVRHGLGLPY